MRSLADAESVGKLSGSELEHVRASNRKLIRLELFMMVIGLAVARLPRFVAALEMHANLAESTAPSQAMGAQDSSTAPDQVTEDSSSAASASTREDAATARRQDVQTLRLAAVAMREQLRAMEMVKTEATDMAKKLERFDGQ